MKSTFEASKVAIHDDKADMQFVSKDRTSTHLSESQSGSLEFEIGRQRQASGHSFEDGNFGTRTGND